MALVDAGALMAVARELKKVVPALPVAGVTELYGALQGAERVAMPVILTLPPLSSPFHEAVAAAVEVAAERAGVPVVILQTGVGGETDAALALNRGVTALVLASEADVEGREEVSAAAEACGAPLWEAAPRPDIPEALPGEVGWVDLGRLWPRGGEGRGEAAVKALAEQAAGLMGRLPPWEDHLQRLMAPEYRRTPVDHVILFNVEGLDEAGVRAMLEEGARVLGPIAGVRDLAAGVAVKAEVAYRYHWMVRFAHPNVIPYYRDHPAHVAFADGHFRPVAGDRVSIDYRHLGRAHGGRPLD